MLRTKGTFPVKDAPAFKQKLLKWLEGFSESCYLDSNESASALGYHSYDCLAAAGSLEIISSPAGNALTKLKDFHNSHPDWLFGFLTYDLKNEIEKLHSANADGLEFPGMFFFRPQHIILLNRNEVKIESTTEPSFLWEKINNMLQDKQGLVSAGLIIKNRTSRETYMQDVEAIRNHIAEGDVYELNYCMEFYAEDADISPFDIFRKLIAVSPMPFSAFIRVGEKYLLCASPERFLKKEGRKLISQPIKGTARRGKNEEEDKQNILELKNSPKEQAENVMIVDLVRNDLARSSIAGTVDVEELFGIYSFRQLHQMISTVTSQMKIELHFTDAIRNAFPMGSMTGAPKIMTMQLIEKYEKTMRGLYSGAAGYITPTGDFDLNVVIRSILYNAEKKYLSFQVGSAITYDSKPEEEYEECLLKAAAIFKVLNGD